MKIKEALAHLKLSFIKYPIGRVLGGGGRRVVTLLYKCYIITTKFQTTTYLTLNKPLRGACYR